MIYAIFKVGNALQIGRVMGAHNLSHPNTVTGPFSTFLAAQGALESLVSERRCINAN